jgi:hypothetical protein
LGSWICAAVPVTVGPLPHPAAAKAMATQAKTAASGA